jgi:hypothetical protein
VEEVMHAHQSTFRLVWQELLSHEEIENWALRRKIPERIQREIAGPGVYRFIFPEAVDGAASHTPCYVGEGGNLGNRLRKHFALPKETTKRLKNGTLALESGWAVRGNVQNARGQFVVQVLAIQGSINIGGVSILENLAILHSERFDKLLQLNRGVPETSKNLIRGFKRSRVRTGSKIFQDVTEGDLLTQGNG